MNKLKKMYHSVSRFYNNKCAALSAAFVSAPFFSFAQSVGVTDDTLDIKWPWEKMLNTLVKELTGPLPMALGVIAIVGAAAALFTGNHGGFMKTILCVIIGVTLMLYAGALIGFFSDSAGGVTISGM